ncbi:MAG: zinc ribbon domain-containing protein [Anaerolineae bacterium]|nr:zinc ribbon domain-containing protein [Anaerolineae bacterium]
MPIFEYECRHCGRHFEKFVLSARSVSVACPVCGSDNVRKVLSAFATSGRGATGGATSCLPSG